MTTVFYTRPYDRLIELQTNVRRKKVDRTNQGFNFLGSSFNNRDNLEEKINPSILKDYFSTRKDLSIFKSIAAVFLDRSNETS